MNKTKQLIAGLVIIALGVGGVFLYTGNDVETSESNTVEVVQSPIEQEAKPAIVSSEDQKTVSYEGQTGKTALEILQAGADVTTQSSDFGDFVTGINGVEADSSKEYWSFYVNGEYANEGAGTYQTSDGEQIQWKLEQL